MGAIDRDEERHRPDADLDWTETYVFDFWSADAGTGGFTWLTLKPARRLAWYWSAFVAPGSPVVHVATEARPPVSGLTVRAHGLWADHICEAPFEQWTVRNECHAVALDDPEEALGRGHGVATALALDVEWYASGPPSDVAGGYEQAGEALAVVERVGGPLAVEGPAHRWHAWGKLQPPGHSRPPTGRRAVAAVDGVGIERTLTTGGWCTAVLR
jgi:hypothetical protein